MPLEKVSDIQAHSKSIEKMCLNTMNDRLFTVGKDGMLCIFEIKDRDPQKTGATLQQNLFSSEILTEKSEMDQFNNDAQQLE